MTASLVAKRGAGGLVSGIGPVVAAAGATWVAAALSDGDRLAAASGVIDAEGFRVQSLDIDTADLRLAYDVVANGVFWFLHHNLFDLTRRPRFDTRWREAWEAYRRYNQAFATALADTSPDDAAVLVQDYHLALVPGMLARTRPDLATVHFSHTAFAAADSFRVLPTDTAAEVVSGMAAARACGFHTERWAAAFRDCHTQVVGTSPPRTFVSPLPIDTAEINAVASSGRALDAAAELDATLAGRKLILRVDRIEPSKNLLRGFWAFDDLLERYPHLRGEVVFAALVYPSREALPEYLAYRRELESLVTRINERWARDTWTPVLLDLSDDYPRSVAALCRYDVLLVNPLRDGLNLVAKEGSVVNERDGVLVLSTEAGVHAELGEASLDVNPFDISATADRLAEALAMPDSRRAGQARARRSIVEARRPEDWLRDQLRAAGTDVREEVRRDRPAAPPGPVDRRRRDRLGP